MKSTRDGRYFTEKQKKKEKKRRDNEETFGEHFPFSRLLRLRMLYLRLIFSTHDNNTMLISAKQDQRFRSRRNSKEVSWSAIRARRLNKTEKKKNEKLI